MQEYVPVWMRSIIIPDRISVPFSVPDLTNGCSSLSKSTKDVTIEETVSDDELKENRRFISHESYMDYFDQQFSDNIHFSEEMDNELCSEICTEFSTKEAFAKALVDSVIKQSEVTTKKKLDSLEEMDSFLSSETMSSSFKKWPTIEDFRVEDGANCIDEYLAFFETDEDWMYVIYYQGELSSSCCTIHKYQVLFSLPTWRYPIVQATASIYFMIELCHAKPSYCMVNVSYRYETFTQTYKPGEIDFDEKWLCYILDAKINLFRTITY